MQRPCVQCGELTPSSPCGECRAVTERARHARQSPRDHAAFANGTRWKNFSKRLRRMSPSCEFCGSPDQLTVDHIIPVSEAPELTYVLENCRILCRSCNSRRQDNVTDTERAEVQQRIADRAARRRPGGMTQNGIVRRRRRWGQPQLQSMEIARQGDI